MEYVKLVRAALENTDQLNNAYRALEKAIMDSFYNVDDFMEKNKEEIIKNIEKERRRNGLNAD